MRVLIILLLSIIANLSFSQTNIYLKHKSGPKHDYQFVNPKDTAFVSVYRDEDMGQWTNPYYVLKTNIPDGKYIVYINKIVSLEAFVINQQADSTWTHYNENGNLWYVRSYKNGKMHGNEIHYHNSGGIFNIGKYENGNFYEGASYYESGYISHKSYKQGDSVITKEFADSAVFRTSQFDNAKNTFYIFNPKSAGIYTDEISMEIPYELDPYTLVIAITKTAKQHPERLKKFLNKNKLVINEDDFISVFKPASPYYNSYAIRVSRKNKAKFTKSECKELQALRDNRNLIRLAGPRIVFLSDTIINKIYSLERYALFTNMIDVLIDTKDESAFFKLIENEKLHHVYKSGSYENKVYYRLIYNNDVGAGINEIAARLLGNKIILMTYPIVEQIRPKNSHEAKF